MKYFLLFIFCIFISAHAQEEFTNNFSKCGEYIVRGKIQEENARYFILFGEKSKSETKIFFNHKLNLKLIPKLNKQIDIKLSIDKVSNIKSYLINNLNIHNIIPSKNIFNQDGIKLVKEIKCSH